MTNNLLSRTLTGVALLALATFTLPVFSAGASCGADMLKQVQSAKTPADHEAIAKHYDAEAADATQSAAMHRNMGESYKGLAGGSSGKGAGASAMPGHCESLAKNFDAEAEHFKSMAQTHRDIAK